MISGIEQLLFVVWDNIKGRASSAWNSIKNAKSTISITLQGYTSIVQL